MFFVLAKILWFLAQPSSLIAIAILAGALLAATAWKRLARALLLGGVLALGLAGLLPFGDILIRPLEGRFPRADLDRDPARFAGVIVLGGAEDNRAIGRRELAALNEAAERFTEGVALLRRLPQARLVFTGGSGAILRQEQPEAVAAGRLFEALGVPSERIVLEAKSRDTWENALFTHRLLQPKPGERWLLVTTAWHMPRAMACFRQAGFAVEAWPVDYRTPEKLQLTRLHTSIPEGLRRVDFATREYVGLVLYYLTGRIGALWPGP